MMAKDPRELIFEDYYKQKCFTRKDSYYYLGKVKMKKFSIICY